MSDANEPVSAEQPVHVSTPTNGRIGQERAQAANGSSWASEEEIDTFDQFVRRFWNGEISDRKSVV